MSRVDQFEELARYYDPIMEHVDYDRWYLITSTLAELFPPDFRHIDAACGTGVLLNMLRQSGWNSVGFDLSFSMARIGRKKRGTLPLCNADLTALPFVNAADFITCLFDSINFLLDAAAVRTAFQQVYAALNDGGVFYFDVVTERMVTEHFENQSWTENNGTFTTTWSSTYDRVRSITNSSIRINTAQEAVIRERIYPIEEITEMLRDAGLVLLAQQDANAWTPIKPRSTRVDFVVAKKPDDSLLKQFRKLKRSIPLLIR